MIEYRFIKEEELTKELFKDFIRHQIVNDCWRREEGKWVIKPDPFIDDWTPQEYEFLVTCLQLKHLRFRLHIQETMQIRTIITFREILRR